MKSRRLAKRLGVHIVTSYEKYLGLLTVVGRSKKVFTKGVKEKLRKKLQGWKGMILSKAGREVMMKVVAQSIPVYMMSLFKFPYSSTINCNILLLNFGVAKRTVKGRFIGFLGKNMFTKKGG